MPTSAEAKSKNRRAALARQRALAELARSRPDDFSRLLDEMRNRLGLPPIVQRKNHARAS